MDKIVSVLAVLAVFFFLILASSVQSKMSFRLRLSTFFISLVVIQLIFSYRAIGLDLEPYRLIFENFDSKGFSLIGALGSGLEPGFQLIISALKNFSFGFNGFLFFASFFPLIIFGFVSYRASSPILALLLFSLLLMFKGFDVIRQFFSASMYLLALYLLSRRFIVRSFATVLSSIFFHYSSIVSVFVFPLLRAKWPISFLFLAIFFSFFLGLFLKHALINFDALSDTYVGWKFNYYLKYSSHYEFSGGLHRYLFWVVNFWFYLFSIPMVFLALIRRRSFENDLFINIILNSCCFGIVFATFFVGAGAIVLGMRVHFGLSIGLFLVVSELLSRPMPRSLHEKLLLPAVISWLLIPNFFIVLYNAGVHQVKSPFFISG